ncbi:MAG: serine hydrolase domain-containing protein [Chloroflexota bacterium]
MKKLRNVFLVIVLVSVFTGLGLYAFAPHAPAIPKQGINRADLEAYLNQLVASGNPPGLSLVVVKDGQIVYNRAFGYADGPHQTAATPDTVYHWWSVTKIPTAIAILQLQERGLLTLDDTVVKYLPWFEVVYPSKDGDRAAITLRHLLQHSSGLPDVVPAIIGWTHTDDAGRNQTELVRKFLPQYNKLKFLPGEKAIYSNLNYMVLGAVIEAVSGQLYESYLVENILQPLGMSRTGFVYSSAMSDHEAAGSLPVVHFYTPLLPFLVDTSTLIRERQAKLFWFERVYIDVTPSTGLIGPASDLARLMLAYLNQGTLDGVSILTPQSVSLMTNTPALDGCGLGWAVGQGYVAHDGGGPGFAATMRLYPQHKLGIAVLANGTDLDRTGLADLLANIDW